MTPSTQEHSVVAIYDSHRGAEAAAKALEQAGVDMKALSVVVPAIGPLVVEGPLVGWVVGALKGAEVAGPAGVLAAALTSLGLSEESVVTYELAVKAGKFLVLARGPAEVIEIAHSVLAKTGASQLVTHAAERLAYLARASIMSLLSDEEVARVSTAESALRLAQGDEYLDLEQLDLGVRRAHGTETPIGRVLPRRAVHDKTWRKILIELAVPTRVKSGHSPSGDTRPTT